MRAGREAGLDQLGTYGAIDHELRPGIRCEKVDCREIARWRCFHGSWVGLLKPFGRFLGLLGFSFLCLVDLRAASIWVEGEDARVKRNSPHPWYDSVKKNVLSGGNWISNFNQNNEGFVSYQFEVPTDDSYTFWVRANHVQAALSFRLNS